MRVSGGRSGPSEKARWLLATAMLALACRTVTPEVTGVRIVTSWGSGMEIDQLAIELHDADGEMLGPRELRPRVPSGPLPSGADVVVYLPDGQSGKTLRVRVQGLLHGSPVASAEALVKVAGAEVLDVPMSFGGARDAGASDASDASTPAALANGLPCTAGSQCRSSHCTDGMCCESASCGPCRACNLPGTTGLCRNSPAGTICDSTRCHSSGEGVVRDDLCDGEGICVNSGTMFCDGYRCNPTTIKCYTSCTDDTQCAAGRTCRSASSRCE